MRLQNIKNQKGFTIVELLIVIVVIGILAAIVIVAYTGIQDRANSTSAQSAADTVVKKAQAYHVVEASYPVDIAAFATVNESDLTDVSVTDATGMGTAGATAPTTEPTEPGDVVICVNDVNLGDGLSVYYWDYDADSMTSEDIGTGGGC